MREDAIRSAIENLPGSLLERVAFELLRRVLYPGLNPTSESHDLGEDARTESSVIELHDGRRVSMFASKTAKWSTIKRNCERCKETARHLDIAVFVTSGDPRRTTVETWEKKVKKDYGWDLEVRTILWLAPVAAHSNHESLVQDYLGIPPLEGDFTSFIVTEFDLQTNHALQQTKLHIPGLPDSFPRNEVTWIEDQLGLAKPVILIGEPGTGKSGIGGLLSQSAIKNGQKVLLLDARRVSHIRDERELCSFLSLKGSIHSAISRLGRYYKCRFIIDQLDNVIGLPVATILVELAIECSKSEGVEVIVISRKREGHENKLLDKLVVAGFVAQESHLLDESSTNTALNRLGISDTTSDLVSLGRNLLNLELIGTIKLSQPSFDFTAILQEVDLWDSFIEALKSREEVGVGFESSEKIIAEAVNLSRKGLNSDDRAFCLDSPLSQAHRRLDSWGMIVPEEEGSLIYRFRHEKLQDYLYAWDATRRNAMPETVMSEIQPHKSGNVLDWMDKIYARRHSPRRIQFLKEMLLNV